MALSLELTPGALPTDGDLITPSVLRAIARPTVALLGTIGSALIDDGSIITAKLADGSVTAAKLADGSVTAAKLANDLVGGVLQMVTATDATYRSLTNTIPLDNSIPQQSSDGGTAILTATIVPRSATSKLLVEARVPCMSTNTAAYAVGALFRDATEDAVGAAYIQLGIGVSNPILDSVLLVSAVVISSALTSTTFKLKVGEASAGAIYINGDNSSRLLGGASAVVLTITEIQA